MHRWMLALIVLVAGVGAARGQAGAGPTQEPARNYQRTFEAAMAAHNAARYDEAIAGFKSCLELVPTDWASAYNVACGHALKKELDPAFEWLGKAIDLGFGRLNIETDEIDLATKDADLASLRADARYAQAMERMKQAAKALEDYAGQAAVHVPAALEGATAVPVLVVLHERGSTKEALVKSFWKDVADELGLALVAPSGRIPLGREPAAGMSWMGDLPRYEKGYWKYERTVHAAFDAFGKQHKVDPARVFIAGQGEGGLVAFNVAVGAPGLYKGAVVLDAGVLPSVVSQKAANAAKLGLRGRFLLSQAGAPPGQDVATIVESMGKTLQGAGLAGVTVASYKADAADPEQRKQLALAALRELLAAGAPAEASAPR